MSKTGVFLDRDDTIIRDMVYLNDPGKIEILPGVGEAIHALNEKDIPAIVITNQSGIARGILSEEMLSDIHLRLLSLLAGQGARIDAIYYCPHHPEGTVDAYTCTCPCRKPEPGLLLEAARDFRLDLESSYMIGDKPIDVETIHRVGGKGVLLSDATDTLPGQQRPDHIARDLHAAVTWVLEDIAG